MTKEILNNPHKAGENARVTGHSIHYNPFRNYEGYSQEYLDWEAGWNSSNDNMVK